MLSSFVTITTMCGTVSKIQIQFFKTLIQNICKRYTLTFTILVFTQELLFTLCTSKVFTASHNFALIEVLYTTMRTLLFKNIQTINLRYIKSVNKITNTTKVFRTLQLRFGEITKDVSYTQRYIVISII